MNAVCLTGNRPHKLPFVEGSREHQLLIERMNGAIRQLIGEGYRHFITGMALGSDIWFAECVLGMKDVYPDVFLEAAVPYAGQRDGLAAADRFRYDAVLSKCAKVTVLGSEYTKYCMSRRNRYMVDNSDVVLVVLYSETGGTANTLAYARKKGKRIIDLS
ncbi:MAG TPA: DUF1273 family protein [Firmicutes bacterium]|nr:DUF1273 family protein [Bacillota bacterium]